jgi:1-acyl-sn-glycerol-3-phosphate acyltransferase
MATLLDNGQRLILFPEGTSSSGDTVLPFRSSLFEPVTLSGTPVTPVSLRYHYTDGSPCPDVAYWGDMTVLPHLIQLLSLRDLAVTVSWGHPLLAIPDRKTLARASWQQVNALHQSSLPTPPSPETSNSYQKVPGATCQPEFAS